MQKWYNRSLQKIKQKGTEMKNRINHIVKFGAALIAMLYFLLVGCNTGTKNVEQPKTDTVVIDQMKFIPADITINKGDTVLFINKDIVAHNATEVSNAWASPTLNTGDSWSTVPDKSADYFCSIHIVMKGKITVK